MAKKNNNNETENLPVATSALGDAELSTNSTAPVSKKNAKKGKNDKNKKPNIFVRIGKSFKEMFSEMKKVTWADGKNVLSSTLVVLGVVFIFFIGILGIDSGLSALLNLLITKG